MTTPPAQPSGSDPAERPEDTPPSGWPAPGQPGPFPPPPGQYGGEPEGQPGQYGAQYGGSQYSGGQYSGGQYSGGQYSGGQYSGGQYPGAHPAGDYPGADHPGAPGSYPGPATSPFPSVPPGYPGYGEVPGGYPQPGYGVAGAPYGYPADPNAPFGYDPMGRPYSDKQKLIAGLLQILVGGFGVGRFYTGHTGIAVAQLVVTLVTCGVGALWGLIDGIMILVNGGTDAQGRPLREN